MMTKVHENSEDEMLIGSLRTIDKQVNKLTTLISDLLDISKIEGGRLPLQMEPFVLSQLVEDAIADIQAAIPTHKIKLDKGSAGTVYADKDRISQVLVNLFTNAIKYSPQANEVEVEIREKDGEVVVKITDFGIGILASDLDNIFTRFYRVSGKDEKTYPGFGIGLYIVKEIIELHNGRLWVESIKEEGSQFYFTLPKKEYFTKE